MSRRGCASSRSDLGDRILRLRQASDMAGVSVRTMSRWVATGLVPSMKSGSAQQSARMIPRAALVAFLRERGAPLADLDAAAARRDDALREARAKLERVRREIDDALAALEAVAT